MNTMMEMSFICLSLMSASVLASRPVIRVAGIGHRPFLDMSKLKTSEFPGGVDMELVHIVAEHLDVDIKFNASTTWGAMDKNGTWSGTVAEVLHGRADVGIGVLSIAHPRSAYVDFSTPIYFADIRLLSNKPQALPQHFNLVKPFTIDIWLFTILALLASAIFQPWLPKAVLLFSSEAMRRGLKLFGSLLVQSNAGFLPQPLSRLIFGTAWLIFATVLVMAYDCNLRAYLIHVDYEKPIDGPEDVLEQQKDFYYARGTNLEFIISAEGQGPFKTMVERAYKEKHHFKNFNGTMTTSFVMELYEEDRVIISSPPFFVFIVAKATQAMGRNPFRLGTQTQMLDFCGFAFAKGSSLRASFDKVLLRLLEAGIVDKLKSDFSMSISDETQIEDSDTPLNMDHIIIPGLILGFGLACSTITLAIEMKFGRKPGLQTRMHPQEQKFQLF